MGSYLPGDTEYRFQEPGNRIMERDAYIPYKERTLKELCRDIDLKAKETFLKLNKTEKSILISFISVLLVCVALSWHYNGGVDRWVLPWFVAIVVEVIVAFIINKMVIKSMKRAASHKQFFRIARGLKRYAHFRIVLRLVLYIWPVFLPNTMDDVWCYAAFLIAVIGIRIGVQIFEPDDIIGKDFCTDLDELEYRLEE